MDDKIFRSISNNRFSEIDKNVDVLKSVMKMVFVIRDASEMGHCPTVQMSGKYNSHSLPRACLPSHVLPQIELTKNCK